MPQLHADPRTLRIDTARAFTLIGRGLAKKLVVASFLATAITDDAFAEPGRVNAFVMLVAIYAYAVQIYADFSGYTDMAIGFGLLLGFELPPNFDRPYTATSVQDFWSRWHMTLSRFLRDYLFATFTGRRQVSLLRASASIVGVMLVAGLWHGAAWGFVVFGGVHGVAMAVERARRQRRRRLRRPPPARTPVRLALRRIGTFHVVCLGWLFFASGSIHRAADVLSALTTNWSTPVTMLTPLLVVTVVGMLALQYLPGSLRTWSAAYVERVRPALQSVGFAAALVPILALAPATVPAFIYYRF
jgi:D-alanyl-lipoteichoic acid acyltransferase DltB (MBOAT superfamily)